MPLSFLKKAAKHAATVKHAQDKTSALILAAGNSTRMGGKVSKQFLDLCGNPVLAYTLLAYQSCPLISEIILAARREDFDMIAEIREAYGITKLRHVVAGGANRQESARKAFSKISPDTRYVAIADGARCLVTTGEIEAVCKAAYRYKAASAAKRVVGTLKRATESGLVAQTVSRENLWEAQTPQVFHVTLYAAALNKAIKENRSETDDNAMVEHIGQRIKLVECSNENIKITTPEDMNLASAILTMRMTLAQQQTEEES
jgi:2-C-methyl-D-erythritol 4-phosphate cytidylyltransferase